MGAKTDRGFFRATSGGDDDDAAAGGKPRASGSGAEGSRAGWWMRAAHDIAAHYTSGDIERALWDFPVIPYFLLCPAALEAAGQLPEGEHYAIKEGLKAARLTKQQRRAARGENPQPKH